MAKVKTRKTPRSEYLQALFPIGDALAAVQNADDLQSVLDDLEALRDEAQEKLDNMPEGLQSGPTGERIQERIDNLETVIDNLGDLKTELEEADEALGAAADDAATTGDESDQAEAEDDLGDVLEKIHETVFELDGYEAAPAPVVAPAPVEGEKSGATPAGMEVSHTTGELTPVVTEAEDAENQSVTPKTRKTKKVKAEKPAAGPGDKLVLLALDGAKLTSRRVPTDENRAGLTKLVGQFGGGKTFSREDMAKGGFSGDSLKNLLKRLRSYYGNGVTAQTTAGVAINLKMPT